MSPSHLREHAINIWKAGVAAVDSAQLVENVVRSTETGIEIAGVSWELNETGRICVVGAGKAGAGMAAGFERSLTPELMVRLSGIVNVPDDCVQQLKQIQLRGARPAGVNEPTAAGVEATQKILECVGQLTEKDLCVVLISGGGSALLPAPVDGITLADKQQVTRLLMRSGTPIRDMNCVRSALSRVKGGGLLRACRAGRLITLIISDVIGDPLESIASGPTVNTLPDPERALAILNAAAARTGQQIPEHITKTLAQAASANLPACNVEIPYSNHVIGNNRTAVDAAIAAAEAGRFRVVFAESDQAGIAKEVGSEFAQRCLTAKTSLSHGQTSCLISGGEPVVQLAETDGPQKGGRNQEFDLAAAAVLQNANADGIVILSGGTDGEDGPTDAAGAIIDSELLKLAEQKKLRIDDYLTVNNSYPFFEQIGGLIKTGPTHTNVMDLRIGLVAAVEEPTETKSMSD